MPSQARTWPVVPVFPLPDYYLFPGTLAPLQIFETRYRQMMDDLMDGPGRMVILPYSETTPREDFGPILPKTGTLVEVAQHERLTDGRWLIMVMALDRVAVTEVPSDRLYRKVQAEVLAERVPVGSPGIELYKRVIEALEQRTAGDWDTPQKTPLGRLADLLLHALPLDSAQKCNAYNELNPGSRAELALDWHHATGSDAERAGES